MPSPESPVLTRNSQRDRLWWPDTDWNQGACIGAIEAFRGVALSVDNIIIK